MLFLSLSGFSVEDLAVETYCFDSASSRTRAETKLSSIFVNSDKLQSENNCLTIQMRPHRRELLQNFARNIDPGMTVTFSSAEIRREPCKLQVEKIRNNRKNDTRVVVTNFPAATTSQVTDTSKDVMQIQTLDKFSFTVSQDAIEGNCRYITQDRYEITINARRDPRPIVPPNLPPGSIVVIPTPPVDQKTLNVSTSLQLNRGDRIEIGGIVRELRNKEQGVDLNKGAQVGDAEVSEDEKVFLTLQ